MNKKIVKIPAINGHYSIVNLRDKLTGIDGVKDVRADVTTKQVRILWIDPATWNEIAERLAEIDFPAEE